VEGKSTNILQITKYFYPATSFGGPVQCTFNLSKCLKKNGHNVTVYTTDALAIGTNARIKNQYQEIEGISVFNFRNTAKFCGLFISPGIIQALKAHIEEFDVVHLHEYRTFQNLVFDYLKKNVPYVLSCHGEFTYKEEQWNQRLPRRLFDYVFGKKLVRHANKLIALTQFEAYEYLKAGIKPHKIAIVPNGVAAEDFSNLPPKGYFRTLFGIKEQHIILYLGRLHKRKGIDTLVKAFSLLSRNRSDARLVLAGPDDGFLGTLETDVRKFNLKDKVSFTGSLNRKQVLAAYNEASVVVYPSIQEGFPIVPLEAGIMGKPIIVSDDVAMDFVREGRFGLTIKYGNTLQLEEALETILNRPEISRELGANGKEYVMRCYSWENIAKKVENIYSDIS
jgi:glycosyltransferase involved in cell wall biosynthesis